MTTIDLPALSARPSAPKRTSPAPWSRHLPLVITRFLNGGPGFVGNDAHGFQLLIPPGGDAPGAFAGCQGINNARQVSCVVTDANGNTLAAFLGSPED